MITVTMDPPLAGASWPVAPTSSYAVSSERGQSMSRSESPVENEITALLRRYGEGEQACLGEVIELVYDELRRLARHQLRRSSVGQQLDATVLVNEAFEKLVRGKTQRLEDRRHFFAIASRAMRQVVVDQYRANAAAKRGAGAVFVTLDTSAVQELEEPEQLVAVHQALEKLGEHSPDLVATLDMACFGGLSPQEIAELTDCNVRTVQRKLQRARAWLVHFMAEE